MEEIMALSNTHKKRIGYIIVLLGIFIAINFLANEWYTRLDLTKEKRHSLTDASKTYVESVEDLLYIKVYLEGDFPAGFKRLRNATEDLLEEFKSFNPENIEFEFINPFEGITDEKELNNIMSQLAQKGLTPTNVKSNSKIGKAEQNYIFPGALISYQGKEIPINFLQAQARLTPAQTLNNSVSSLEYSFLSGIRKAMTDNKPRIGMIAGHGEVGDQYIYDFVKTLSEFYDVERIVLNDSNIFYIPEVFQTIVIAQPQYAFDEVDKYKLDQYLMNGGNIIWMVDPVSAAMDSLKTASGFAILPKNLNLDDYFFNYGARINQNLIQDDQCAPHPFNTGYMGNRPQFELFPWLYYPIVVPQSNHPIVNNMDAVLQQFVSSIDTVGRSNIKKTPLLQTSKYSRSIFVGARVSPSIIQNKPEIGQFNTPNLITAVLLEGDFNSLYKTRGTGAFIKNVERVTGKKFIESTDKGKMIIISDGDMIKNDFDRQGEILPVGYYKYTGQEYTNKKLLMNCVEYMTNSAILEANSKSVTFRPLDKKRIEREKNYWIGMNLILPIVIILLFRVVYVYIRFRKYKSKD